VGVVEEGRDQKDEEVRIQAGKAIKLKITKIKIIIQLLNLKFQSFVKSKCFFIENKLFFKITINK
jgi:hypothetical protein